MPSIGLAEAAKLTGRNQSTIHRAMKTGRLSFTRGVNGERQIDTSELDRVFGMRVNGEPAMAQALAHPVASPGAHAREIELLQRQLEDRDAAIRDLRARLDASETERRATQAQLTAVLADMRTSPKRRSWWPWRRH